MRDESPATGDDRSSEKFAQDVLAAARALGYSPEAVARRVRFAWFMVLVAVCLTAFAVGVFIF
ncbi:hypothetical protein QCN29_24370 [Streptomyces sp. HNM0663]|uniref:Uncharacterized protein n=1 Tax=Streptomyces chengmaiensis TaxID=3040919 RepID=A0ABT6HT16_9ACTN|nr:hypothetical protein [Streptomyces chengmaiensis]MDH2391857.1 hypothetical protein [Streptomyces chengmaiensis]